MQLVLEGWPRLTEGLLLPTACPRRGRQEPEPTAEAGSGAHAAGLLTDWTCHVKRDVKSKYREYSPASYVSSKWRHQAQLRDSSQKFVAPYDGYVFLLLPCHAWDACPCLPGKVFFCISTAPPWHLARVSVSCFLSGGVFSFRSTALLSSFFSAP